MLLRLFITSSTQKEKEKEKKHGNYSEFIKMMMMIVWWYLGLIIGELFVMMRCLNQKFICRHDLLSR
jgi:hypothetical protein